MSPPSNKRTPEELNKYHWFYGNITEEHTKAELGLENSNTFLVRHTSDTLILSWGVQHTTIHYSRGGYCLEGRDRHFWSIPEMIACYQKYPIVEKHLAVLGKACDRRSKGILQ